jgi:hypothetical protein
MMRQIGNGLVVAAFVIATLLIGQDAWFARYRPQSPNPQFMNHLTVHNSATSLRDVFVSQHDLHVRWTIVAVVVVLFAAGTILKASSGEE